MSIEIFCLFFSYWVVWILHIFWVLTPAKLMICKYFLPFYRPPVHFVVSLVQKSFLVWCGSTYFCFHCLHFWCQKTKTKKPKSPMPRLRPESFIHLFFFFFCGFMPWGLMFKLYRTRVNFCERCKVVVQFHSSASGCPVFSTPFMDKTIFPHCINWPSICWFISGLSMLFHWFLRLFLYQYTLLFWLLRICDIVRNQEAWCLKLCSSFSFGYSVCFMVYLGEQDE